MKIFISYTVRDGHVDKHLLMQVYESVSKLCEIYIDLLHNIADDPQREVVRQLKSSDMVIQITSPSIDESKWASLEKKLAKKNMIPTYYVNFTHMQNRRLIYEIIEIIVANMCTHKIQGYATLWKHRIISKLGNLIGDKPVPSYRKHRPETWQDNTIASAELA